MACAPRQRLTVREIAVATPSLFGRDQQLAQVRRDAFIRGTRAIAPALLATSIWGLVAGVAMIKTGLTTAQALAMTLLVYSGTGQMAVLPLIAAGAPVSIALVTAAVVNLRFVVFSATLWPYFGRLALHRRLLLGYLSADIGLAVFIARYGDAPVDERGDDEQRWFYLGILAATWLSWQPMSILGIALAEVIPEKWGLEYAAILALIAILLPMFSSRPVILGGLTAGIVAVPAAALPLKLGLLLAVIAGVAVAMAADVHQTRATKDASP
jgi:predicted branched-subunit amino acid permease